MDMSQQNHRATEEFKRFIQEFLRDKGLTQREIVTRTGICSEAAFSGFLHGRIGLQYNQIFKFLRELSYKTGIDVVSAGMVRLNLNTPRFWPEKWAQRSVYQPQPPVSSPTADEEKRLVDRIGKLKPEDRRLLELMAERLIPQAV
jgi:transcriptional regulator with XRE-family HTH domain